MKEENRPADQYQEKVQEFVDDYSSYPDLVDQIDYLGKSVDEQTFDTAVDFLLDRTEKDAVSLARGLNGLAKKRQDLVYRAVETFSTEYNPQRARRVLRDLSSLAGSEVQDSFAYDLVFDSYGEDMRADRDRSVSHMSLGSSLALLCKTLPNDAKQKLQNIKGRVPLNCWSGTEYDRMAYYLDNVAEIARKIPEAAGRFIDACETSDFYNGVADPIYWGFKHLADKNPERLDEVLDFCSQEGKPFLRSTFRLMSNMSSEHIDVFMKYLSLGNQDLAEFDKRLGFGSSYNTENAIVELMRHNDWGRLEKVLEGLGEELSYGLEKHSGSYEEICDWLDFATSERTNEFVKRHMQGETYPDTIIANGDKKVLDLEERLDKKTGNAMLELLRGPYFVMDRKDVDRAIGIFENLANSGDETRKRIAQKFADYEINLDSNGARDFYDAVFDILEGDDRISLRQFLHGLASVPDEFEEDLDLNPQEFSDIFVDEQLDANFPLSRVYDSLSVSGYKGNADAYEAARALVVGMVTRARKKGADGKQHFNSEGLRLALSHFDKDKIRKARNYIQGSAGKVYHEFKGDLESLLQREEGSVERTLGKIKQQIIKGGKREKVEPISDMVAQVQGLTREIQGPKEIVFRMQDKKFEDIYDNRTTHCCAFYPSGVNSSASLDYLADPDIGLLQAKALDSNGRELENSGVAILVNSHDKEGRNVLLVDSVEGGNTLNKLPNQEGVMQKFYDSIIQVGRDRNANEIFFNAEVTNGFPERFLNFLETRGLKTEKRFLVKDGNVDEEFYLESFGEWNKPRGKVEGFVVRFN